jgi:hypothetical protein
MALEFLDCAISTAAAPATLAFAAPCKLLILRHFTRA